MGRQARTRSDRRAAAAGTESRRPPAAGDGRGSRSASVAAAALALLFVAVLVWAAPRPMVDTFMGLAGGRDVFDGKLGKPDDWSFMTAGRVWTHQNWGFDALMYGAFRAGGNAGLLALKALVVLAIAGAVVLAARARGAGWAPALVAAAAALAGARQHFELRANLATYLLLALLLAVIYASRRRPALLWLSVPLFAAWANLHGGFTAGLAVLAVWAGAVAVEALRTGGVRLAAARSLQPAAALAASVAAVVAASRLGVENLTHTFTMLGNREWRGIEEWRPSSFGAVASTAGLWALTVLVAAVGAVALWRVARREPANRTQAGRKTPLSTVLFDAGLLVLLVAMAASARRFVPVALVALAPLLAAQAEFALARLRPWAPAAASVALAASLLPFAVRTAARYAPANPRFPHHDAFERMVSAEIMPVAAAAFLSDNDIEGRIVAEWSWEGIIHWLAPRPKLLIGGRAQQIYSVATLHVYDEVLDGARPDETLAPYAVHVVVIPFQGRWVNVIDRLAFARGSHWAAVFYDGRALVLADARAPETGPLVERVASGGAAFRDPAVAALSRAMCRISPAAGGLTPEKGRDLLAANRAVPGDGTPWALALAATGQRAPLDWFIRLLEAEESYLARRPADPVLRLRTTESRAGFAEVLATLYRSSGQAATASRWGAAAEELKGEVVRVIERT